MFILLFFIYPSHIIFTFLFIKVILLSRDKRGALKSFSMPFVRLRGVELVQPIFGSNHLKGFVRADPDGAFVTRPPLSCFVFIWPFEVVLIVEHN